MLCIKRFTSLVLGICINCVQFSVTSGGVNRSLFNCDAMYDRLHRPHVSQLCLIVKPVKGSKTDWHNGVYNEAKHIEEQLIIELSPKTFKLDAFLSLWWWNTFINLRNGRRGKGKPQRWLWLWAEFPVLVSSSIVLYLLLTHSDACLHNLLQL